METMIHPDARMWCYCDDSIEMTLVELGDRGKCREEVIQWLDTNCEGEYVVTPIYVGFEIPQEATYFNLGFQRGS